MRIDISSGQISFIGKTKEKSKILFALELMKAETGDDCYTFDNSEEEDDLVDVAITYDECNTVEEVKQIWRRLKEKNKAAIKAA